MKTLPEYLTAGVLAATLGAAVWAHAAGDTNQVAVAPETSKGGTVFAIRDVRVFDGERMLEYANVVVRDGKIAAVGADAEIPAGIEAIDGSGKTLLPGLIDAHVHAWGNAQSDALRLGVTTELDMLGDWRRAADIRKQRESMAPTRQADLWSAGAAVTAPEGHGTQYGEVPTLAAGDDAAAFVDARLAEGSDYIKIIVEDFSTHSATRRLPSVTADQVRGAIKAAHAQDRRVIVHVSPQRDAVMAAEAGADGLAHLFIDEAPRQAFITAARKRDMFVIPTLSVLSGYAGQGEGGKLAADPRLQPFLGSEQKSGLTASFPGAKSANDPMMSRLLASVKQLHDAGIEILAGTDAGNPGTAHGASLHGELELLVRAGLTPVQALAAATSLPAKRFGLDDRGRIAPGMRADLLLVDGDPGRDITATRAIAGVWKNGYPVERNTHASAQQAKAAPGDTLVSDFEGEGVGAAFGAWQPTTDQVAGGASVVRHARVEGGAGGSTGALQVSGEVKQGFAYPWSGVIFFPASDMGQTMALSSRKALVFHVRGDGRRYNAMLFSGESMQGMPSMQAFVAGPEWSEVRIPLDKFQGADLSQVRGIAFAAGEPLGAFDFRIDDVELR